MDIFSWGDFWTFGLLDFWKKREIGSINILPNLNAVLSLAKEELRLFFIHILRRLSCLESRDRRPCTPRRPCRPCRATVPCLRAAASRFASLPGRASSTHTHTSTIEGGLCVIHLLFIIYLLISVEHDQVQVHKKRNPRELEIQRNGLRLFQGQGVQEEEAV